MKRTWTIVGVKDVTGSCRWYQTLFGHPETPPVHDDFGQILDADGTVLLCLHQWGAHGHPSLMSPDVASPGNGLILFFRVDDYDTALERARALVPRFEEEPHLNPNTQTREFSLRDPDGYYVTVSALAASGRHVEAPPMNEHSDDPFTVRTTYGRPTRHEWRRRPFGQLQHLQAQDQTETALQVSQWLTSEPAGPFKERVAVDGNELGDVGDGVLRKAGGLRGQGHSQARPAGAGVSSEQRR